ISAKSEREYLRMDLRRKRTVNHSIQIDCSLFVIILHSSSDSLSLSGFTQPLQFAGQNDIYFASCANESHRSRFRQSIGHADKRFLVELHDNPLATALN